MLLLPSFYTVSSAVNKLLWKHYKNIMCRVLTLLINPALFNFFSLTETCGQREDSENLMQTQLGESR